MGFGIDDAGWDRVDRPDIVVLTELVILCGDRAFRDGGVIRRFDTGSEKWRQDGIVVTGLHRTWTISSWTVG